MGSIIHLACKKKCNSPGPVKNTHSLSISQSFWCELIFSVQQELEHMTTQLYPALVADVYLENRPQILLELLTSHQKT